MCFADKVNAPSPSTDFYEWVNNKWLHDDVPIPGDYPRWGAFTKLDKESQENQVSLCQELAEKEDLTEDEAKITKVWNASLERFAEWEEGTGGDDSALRAELSSLEERLGDLEDDETFMTGLASVLSDSQEMGVKRPFTFEVSSNFDDSDSMILSLMPSGLSLPTRGHYLAEAFANQRKFFMEHLDKVKELLGEDLLGEDFAERVFRFERRLAQIMLSPDQARLYDEYYTVTSLEGLLNEVNKLKSLAKKQDNYDANEVEEDDVDADVLTQRDYESSEEDLEVLRTVMSKVVENLGLREVMSANVDKNYAGDKDADGRRERVMVFDGDYFRRVFKLLFSKNNRQDLKAYFLYQKIASVKELCTKELDEVFFDFYGRQLGGQQLQKSSEKRSVQLVNDWVGMLLGKIYVSRYFSEEDKAKVLNMIREVMKVLAKSIKANDWMTKETKQNALKKLKTFRPKIGYPDKWDEFDELSFEGAETLMELRARVRQFEHKTEFLDKINTKKDIHKWHMTPQTVNAYFDPTSNEIVFPAAILQPPFYHKSLDEVDLDLGDIPLDTPGLLDALNFGGIGAVIGHEILHGVDDQGAKFDHLGNIADWWAEEDRVAFKEKCKLMADQAASYTYTDEDGAEHHMSPELTMGENLADAGGLSVACKAMLSHLHPEKRETGVSKVAKKKGKLLSLFRRKSAQRQAAAAVEAAANAEEEKKLRRDHLELLFRGWATVWRSKQTNAFAVKALAMDPHAPTHFRGNTVSNIDEFYEAFDIPEGSPMYVPKEKRVQVW